MIETPTKDLSMQEPLNSPVGVNSPPSYADVLKKKSVESLGSLGEDELFSKKVGRKTQKEIREEEAERLKMQGSQATLEMSNGRNKRNIPPKGGQTPSASGK